MTDRLINLGFTDRFAQEATLYPDLHPARVIAQYKELYRVATGESELLAEISGKMRHAAVEMSDYPAVGDFVMIDRNERSQDHAIIHQTLTRKSVFIRKAAGKAHDVQVVAANSDIVFICMSLNNDFNLRRLERYLAIAWDSGATPVIVLTKADLCADIPGKLREIETIAFGVDVLVTSSLSEDGYTACPEIHHPGPDRRFHWLIRCRQIDLDQPDPWGRTERNAGNQKGRQRPARHHKSGAVSSFRRVVASSTRRACANSVWKAQTSGEDVCRHR